MRHALEYFRQLEAQREELRQLVEGPAAIAMLDSVNAAVLELNVLKSSRWATDWMNDLQAMQLTVAETCKSQMALNYLSAGQALEAFGQSLDTRNAIGLRWPEIAEALDIAGRSVSSIDFDALGGLIGAPNTISRSLHRRTARLAKAHLDVLDAHSGEAYDGGPEFLPTIDVFVHAEALRTVTPHDERGSQEDNRAESLRRSVASETGDFLERLLQELHPPLLAQYHGSKLVVVRGGPDAWTQGGASARKLLKGVLHRAAPDDAVLPWAQSLTRPCDRNGRPTRATKLDWLCEPLADEAYREFVRAELRSAEALMALLDRAQHVDEFPAFDQNYEVIFLRLEVVVRQILELWYWRQAHGRN